MFKFNVVHLAYAIMMFGMVMCYILGRNQNKDLRKAADTFTFTFVKLSNYISPHTCPMGLAVETLEDGTVRPLPLEQQPETIRSIIKRANADKSVKLFSELVDAEAIVAKKAGMNKVQKRQFKDPIRETLMMTHTFLVGCENLDTIDSAEKKQLFDSFIQEQVKHRYMLLRRISGAQSDEYRKLNKHYAAEMEAMERAELEAKRKGHRSAAKKEKAEENEKQRG